MTDLNSSSRQFASDNRSGICPEAWDALARANVGHAPSYGDDPFTAQAAQLLAKLFDTDCEVYFTATGTAANSLAIAAFCESYHSVICHHESHIETDECSAPAYFTHGIKLAPAGGDNGKLTPDTIEKIASQRRDIHSSKPRLVSLSQSTELGTLYQPRELKAISKVARRLGLGLHMDGARFANAVAAIGCSPAELSWKSGVDVLCFGGTKNGMSCGEAVIFFDKSIAADFAYRRKQAGQLLSKMRFISAQWIGMLEGSRGGRGAWLRHATHSNTMARKLEAGLRNAGVKILFPVEANAIFIQMAPEAQTRLHKRGWEFYNFMTPDCVRFMCSWDTTDSDISRLLADIPANTSVRAPSARSRRPSKKDR